MRGTFCSLCDNAEIYIVKLVKRGLIMQNTLLGPCMLWWGFHISILRAT